MYRESHLIAGKNGRLSELEKDNTPETLAKYEDAVEHLKTFRLIKNEDFRIGLSFGIFFLFAFTGYFYCILRQFIKYAPRDHHEHH